MRSMLPGFRFPQCLVLSLALVAALSAGAHAQVAVVKLATLVPEGSVWEIGRAHV